MAVIRSSILLLLLMPLTAGCGREPEPRDTGARAAVQAFYEALLRQDWPAAYALVHSDSKARCSEQQFAVRATEFRRSIGFEPETVHVRSCEEHGNDAVAHVALTPSGESGQRYFKEATTLRQGPDGWAVVLPGNFGQRPSR